ncbi:TIGR04283 family arsenosugar biosynthesis glycosyltransferase [Humitalea sp. 24SJ18S-53]|uniref:TIGR04283 family arsenosugar biosynthesis glycosyltransferase n=1 Tax=Humitalea sp. 24SJ18S-53 TaxID=3422307 RepID=UPI003D67C807
MRTLAVVIPALNAAATLPGVLARLAEWPSAEILVVDGGSTDGTTGPRVISAPRGRGGQLAAGIAATTAPWLLLLHADTRLEPGWAAAVRAFIADPANAGRAAYFRLVLDDPAPQARRIERLVAWRCRAWHLPYGDQGLLVARKTLDAVGGIAPLPLMEDVDLVRRLGRDRMVALPVAAVTSAARYRRDGWWARPMRNLVLLALWRLGVSTTRLARWYG